MHAQTADSANPKIYHTQLIVVWVESGVVRMESGAVRVESGGEGGVWDSEGGVWG